MATIIAVIALLMVVVSLPLVFIKPHWVFYLFIISKVFGAIFYGYIYEAGGLGMGRTWQPADFLALETLMAAFFVQRNGDPVNNSLKVFLCIVIILALLSLIQGFIFNLLLFVLPDTRKLHFIVAMIFSLKYFKNSGRVDEFLKFTSLILIVMFVFHVLLRLGIYVAPEAIQRTGGQLAGERGETALVPVAYLVLFCIGLARFGNKIGSALFSGIIIFAALAGGILSETRSIQGAMVLIGLMSLVFVRGKLKNIIIFSIAVTFIFAVASSIGFNVFARWRSGLPGEGGIRPDAWRNMEYSTIVQSYAAQPYFLVTGRGIGAVHYIPSETEILHYVSYYHSEFLGWLDNFGVAGLVSILSVWMIVAFKSFQLLFCETHVLKYYGTIVFLLMPALFLHSLVSPAFMNERASSLLICFIVIIANYNEIYNNLYSDWNMEELYQEGDLEYGIEKGIDGV